MPDNKEKNTASSSWFVKDVDSQEAKDDAKVLFDERIQRVEDAVLLKEPDRFHCSYVRSTSVFLDGTTYKDAMYNYEVQENP
jgi:hypothetical protein